MISLENIPTEDVVFFSVIVFGGLYTIFFYIMVGFFIKKKKDNFAEKLFGDKTHNLSLDFENKFIISTTFGRLYIFYLFEVVLMRRKYIHIFKQKKNYIFPNLTNEIFMLVINENKFFLNFILVYFIFCVSFFVYLFFVN
ncbi:hypothetical protein U4959_07175 [Acinetobacter junii]|jgi:hypothetical protein|uniref:hypothetical protein n=1 Tax=Acinetobacter TaxID=469 RepID=UPI0005B371A1|nr:MULTISPECIES: hypothetical protein [Acinetobacter]AWA47766.1 hypothetical protein CDG57_07040 [Acinetobacter junii]MBL8280734.1 hypothetical protein [Acinetobacter junii]MDH0720182.1 hypothetical protein [Acinetobacter junii]MDH1689133.1 hypothetical protein [Acinetobacter junii]MQZ57743.1 hypothetical protein [Acinetobacter junii]